MDTVVTVGLVLLVLMPSVILHEVAHGAAALRFGDDTARQAGRLTLNPLAHIDPFGTVILPALLAFTTGAAFGYAKPVPVNPSRMRRPRDHGLLVSLAGPATNVVLALIAAALLRALAPADDPFVLETLFRFGVINVILAAFNLLPIPPLDGSALVERLLPRRLLPQWRTIRQYSMPVLLLIVLLVPGALGRVFGVAQRLWIHLL
ncbi:MAG: site-2 protease family protein [Actinobacteria bacterium]|nr:site-2 protease family protein [Actinomycetota bacterium]